MIKDIPGYEGVYQADEEGNIYKNGVLKKQKRQPSGYMYTVLTKNGKLKNCIVHRLIALTFIANPDNKRCVDHIDYDRSNNNISNLRWATYKENKIHSNPRIEGMNNKNHSPVLHTEYGVFFTVKEVSSIIGQTPQNTSNILNPKHPARNKTKFIYA